MTKITINITDKQKEYLEELQKQQELKPSEYIRRLIDADMNK